jgi:hypothetical protein
VKTHGISPIGCRSGVPFAYRLTPSAPSLSGGKWQPRAGRGRGPYLAITTLAHAGLNLHVLGFEVGRARTDVHAELADVVKGFLPTEAGLLPGRELAVLIKLDGSDYSRRRGC